MPNLPSIAYSYSPQYHEQRNDWDGKLTLLGPSFGDNVDYLSSYIRQHQNPKQLSCVFGNHSRFLLINDVPINPESSPGSIEQGDAFCSVARVIRPFSEQINFGLLGGTGAYGAQNAVFRLAVWEISPYAALFMGKGDKSRNWSMSERASQPSSDMKVQESKKWLEEYVAPSPDDGGKFKCTFSESRLLTYLFVVFNNACVHVVDVGLEKGGIDFIEKNSSIIATLAGLSNTVDEVKTSSWQYMPNPTVVGGAFRTDESVLLDKSTGFGPNAVVAIWEL